MFHLKTMFHLKQQSFLSTSSGSQLSARKKLTVVGLYFFIFSSSSSSNLLGGVSSFSISPQQSQPPLKVSIPEDVVQMQLQALQEHDIKKAFALNSPENQAVTGPPTQFEQLLLEKPFTPIIGHDDGQVLMTISQHDGNEQCYVSCLVRIIPGRNARQKSSDDNDDDHDEVDHDSNDENDNNMYQDPVLYWWEVSKHEDVTSETGYKYMVDSVLPDAEDVESELLELPTFFVGDEYDEDDDDFDAPFYFDMGL